MKVLEWLLNYIFQYDSRNLVYPSVNDREASIADSRYSKEVLKEARWILGVKDKVKVVQSGLSIISAILLINSGFLYMTTNIRVLKVYDQPPIVQLWTWVHKGEY